MKIRNDFVTNSSSSSFIVAFSNVDNISSDLESEKILDPYRRDWLIKELLSGQVSNVEECIAKYTEDIYYDVKFNIEDEIELKYGYNWYAAKNWIDTHPDEFESKIQTRVDTQVDELKSSLADKDFISIVEVSDHDDSEMEHEIMPYLKCVVRRISHH